MPHVQIADTFLSLLLSEIAQELHGICYSVLDSEYTNQLYSNLYAWPEAHEFVISRKALLPFHRQF